MLPFSQNLDLIPQDPVIRAEIKRELRSVISVYKIVTHALTCNLNPDNAPEIQFPKATYLVFEVEKIESLWKRVLYDSLPFYDAVILLDGNLEELEYDFEQLH